MKNNAEDLKWMKRALALAWRGKWAVSPNPLVGACVVKNGKLISSGWHAQYGKDHAEVTALKRAGKRARGATLYVTLEPCSTWGKTPPCTQAIIQAGIRTVVIGTQDPNPNHCGKAGLLLRKSNICIRSGLLQEEIKNQNASFFKWIQSKMPYVTLKMAQTLDGKIAARSGKSRWISSPESRAFVHSLRAEQDAILVGANTVKIDNPSLQVKVKKALLHSEKPWRIVLLGHGKVSGQAKVFQGNEFTIVVIPKHGLKSRMKLSLPKKKGLMILPVNYSKSGFDLKELLSKLGQLGVAKLLVEGGGELAASFLNEGFVDKFYWVMAPKIFGGRDTKTSVEGEGVLLPDQGIQCKIQNVKKSGEDWIFEGFPMKTKSRNLVKK